MKKILNYIVNGQGNGLKYFLLFSMLICLGCWFVFSSVLTKNVQNNPMLNQFFDKIPTLEIVDNHLTEPKNTYLSIPIAEGYSDMLIINTVPDIPVSLNFSSGIYLSTDAIYLKMPSVNNDIQVIEWSEIGNKVIDRAVLDEGVQNVVRLFSALLVVIFCIILWIGYFLVMMATKLFFWVAGYKTEKGQNGRAVTVAWIGVLSMNFVLFFASLQVTLPILFLTAFICAVSFVFISSKGRKQTDTVRQFFDTNVPQNEPRVKGDASQKEQSKPVKISSQKKHLKQVEKPRREATKKTKK